MDREKTALLCMMGEKEEGVKELPGMELGYRESMAIWSLVVLTRQERPGELSRLGGIFTQFDTCSLFPIATPQRRSGALACESGDSSTPGSLF